jgi:hypothetical protein
MRIEKLSILQVRMTVYHGIIEIQRRSTFNTLCWSVVIRSNRRLDYVRRASVRWSCDCTDIFRNDEVSIGLDCYTGMCKSVGSTYYVILCVK